MNKAVYEIEAALHRLLQRSVASCEQIIRW